MILTDVKCASIMWIRLLIMSIADIKELSRIKTNSFYKIIKLTPMTIMPKINPNKDKWVSP